MKEILLHEIRGNFTGGKFVIALLLMMITFLISLAMMNHEYNRRIENYNESLSLSGKDYFYDRLFFWRFEDGHWSSSETYTSPLGKVKPPSTLIFFSRGTDKEMRQSVEYANRIPIVEPTTMPEQESNLLKLIFTAPDILFIVKVLTSLLAITFAYNLITSERENGTLKLLLATGASRTSIFMGKYFGSLFSSFAAFTSAFLVYLIVLSFTVPTALSGENSPRIILLYLTTLFYLAVFFSIGAAISSFNRSSASSLIMSLFFWLLLVFVIPGLSSLVAQQFVPVESNNRIERIKLAKAQEMEREFGEQNPDSSDSYMSGYGPRHDEIRNEINDELQKIDDSHRRKIEYRADLTTNLARISPVGSLTYLYSGLCKTGLADVKLYKNDLSRLRNDLDADLTAFFQDPKMAIWYSPTQFELHPEVVSRVKGMMDLVKNAPFQNLSLEESMRSFWYDYLLLFAFIIIPFVLTYIRFLIYDPR